VIATLHDGFLHQAKNQELLPVNQNVEVQKEKAQIVHDIRSF
ncbi:MAG: hypothetical protein ACI9IA_000327, partial [Enterobacterales bacterium]